MSVVTRPKGRLPARVYWVRRSLVLVVALVLVFAIARVLGSFGGDDASGAARNVAQTDAAEPAHRPGVTLTPSSGAAAASAPLSQPTGTCRDEDVQVEPSVDDLPGGGGHPLTMLVTSTSGETCTWEVSPDSLVVKITTGDRRVWSSQDCPGVITARTVVVRPPEEKATKVQVAWGGHRSVPNCVGGQAYAGLGYYQVQAASVGGEPAQARFRIVAPPRPRVTETASPSAAATKAGPSATASPKSKPKPKASATPSRTPSAKASQGSGGGRG